MKEIVEKMKKRNIKFEKGLSKEEIEKAENVFNIKFPTEIKAFLSYGMPLGEGFYNWRDFSQENIDKVKSFQKRIEEAFLFDFENNDLSDEFKDKFPDAESETELRNKIMEYLHSSPKLVPFYHHRCFFDGMDNMPIISFWQPTDSVFYGKNFEDYLKIEFLNESRQAADVSENLQKIGIWKDLIC